MKRARHWLLQASALLWPHAAWALPGRPLDASLDGHRSDFLFDFVSICVGALFVVMVLAMLWSSLFHRARPGRRARYDLGSSRKQLALTALLTAAIFFGVDGVALVHSSFDLRDGFWKWPTAADQPLTVEVYAQQWAWNFRYPGPDGKFDTPDDVVTLNELHAPVGRPVYLKLKSKDVIHSFYLPNMRIKQDAIPGAVSRLWFQPTRTGRFEIGCAQHCGASHYKMRGELTVEAPGDFERWLARESQAAARRYDAADAESHWAWDWES